MFTAHHFYKAVVSDAGLSSTAVLTWPCEDAAGDIVEPAGGDWTPHRRDRGWIGLEHFRWTRDRRDVCYPGDRDDSGEPVVVAWASPDFRKASTHSVHMQKVTRAGASHWVPTGTAYFDPMDEVSDQAFTLVSKGVLPSVSLEFTATKGHRPAVLKAKSPLENRPAWHFRKWDALAWVVCRQGVNPHATVMKSLVAARLDGLKTVLGHGKLEGRPICGVLFKALKRMEEDDAALMDDDTIYDVAAEEAGLSDGGTGDDGGDDDYEDNYDGEDEGGEGFEPDWQLLDANLSDLIASLADLRAMATRLTANMAALGDQPDGIAKARRGRDLLAARRNLELFARRLQREAVRRTIAGEC